MNYFKTAFFFLVLLLSACDSTSPIKQESIVNKAKVESVPQEAEKEDDNDIWSKFPLKTTPLVDTTNFDNTEEGTECSLEEIEFLQLIKIYPDMNKEGCNLRFFPSYKIELSEDYHTVVLNVFRGDHELDAVLINYTLDNKLIDYKVIAYDEIAEGWIQKYSHIENMEIILFDVFYGETKQVDTTKFRINERGEINPI